MKTIVEIGAYRTPMANFITSETDNAVIIDPLCQSSNIAEAVDALGSRAPLLRIDLSSAAPHVEAYLRQRASVGQRMLVFFGMQLSNEQQRYSFVQLLNHSDNLVMEQAFSKKGYKGGLAETWKFCHVRDWPKTELACCCASCLRFLDVTQSRAYRMLPRTLAYEN